MPILIEGTNFDDELWGTCLDDVILAYNRHDVVHAGGGDDTVFGGGGWDSLYGEDGDDYLNGGDYYDWLSGGSGNDELHGGTQDDHLQGDSGDDELHGDSGDDVLDGGAGADELNGGSGEDTATYESSASGVKVNLTTGVGYFGDAAGDTLEDIENLIGSDHDDALVGNGSHNRIEAGAGVDSLFGFGGADWLEGGEGDDYLSGGTGADELWGGNGTDTASYYESSAAVSVNLDTHTATGGDAAGDKLHEIENLSGSAHHDTLVGDENDNILNGKGGTDTLTGNDGADRFVFAPSESGLARLADRILDFSQADGDLIDVKAVGHKFGVDSLTCTFIGDDAFSGQAGELRFEQSGTTTWVSCDVDGDATADFQILCTGTINFTANDFLL